MAKGIRKATEEVEQRQTLKPEYQEWRVELKYGEDGKIKEVEKLKVIRGRVLITHEQAEILNDGFKYGPKTNPFGSMYFLKD